MAWRIRETLVSLLIATLCGCGTTPTSKWAQASQALTIARDATLSLHEQGIVDDTTLVKVDKVEKVARGALKVAESQLPDGGQTFEQWMAVAKGGIDELAKTYSEKMTAKGANP